MHLINGELKQNIEISDRGFQYGDGVFETIEVKQGYPIFLDFHFRRLTKGCSRLKIPPPDIELLRLEANKLCSSEAQAVLKIIVTRGSGGRGYRLPDPPVQPTRVLSLYRFPEYPQSFYKYGVNLRFCASRLSSNPTLAGIKHMNRLEQVLARSEWEDDDIQEGLMCDDQDRVIEGTMSNLFVIKNNCLYTAPVEEAGIAGIIREIILHLAEERGLNAKEKFFDRSNLISADELFICNSIIGIWPVKSISGHIYSSRPITDQIRQWFEKYKEQWVASQC